MWNYSGLPTLGYLQIVVLRPFLILPEMPLASVSRSATLSQCHTQPALWSWFMSATSFQRFPLPPSLLLSDPFLLFLGMLSPRPPAMLLISSDFGTYYHLFPVPKSPTVCSLMVLSEYQCESLRRSLPMSPLKFALTSHPALPALTDPSPFPPLAC